MARSRRARPTPIVVPGHGPAVAALARVSSRPGLAAQALIATCAVIVGLDSLRVGFYADDFHFLDVARRMPPLDVLLGRHGIWPYYRPLSRELYFWIVASAGPAGLIVARALGIACLAGVAVLIYRLGLKLMSPAAAAAAGLLFVICGLSKFLVAWASGFQDLLATLLTVGAVLAHASGRPNRALALAALAPFAKESGFLAAPLVLAWAVFVEKKRRVEPWMTRQVLVVLGALAIHAGARFTWNPDLRAETGPRSVAHVVGAISGTLASFVTVRLPRDPLTWLAGLAAAACALALLMGPWAPVHEGASTRRGLAFLIAAILIGAAPMVAMFVIALYAAGARFLYPAVPWLSMLLAAGLARLLVPVWRPLLATLVLVDVWGLGYQAPNLDSPEGWKTGALDWAEAQRVWGRTERLAGDVRAALVQRPESLVVIYTNMPKGSWFQTEDGPATRELLGDLTVRAFFANQAPRTRADRMAIMVYDPVETHHLARFPRDSPQVLTRSVAALLRRVPRTAYHWATYAAPLGEARFYGPYLRSAAVLAESGPEDFARELAGAELIADTLAGSPALLQALDGSSGLMRAFAHALRRPLTATAHLACADSLEQYGVPMLVGVELMIATHLAPSSGFAHARLGLLLARNGLTQVAGAELDRALALGVPRESEAEVRAALAALPGEPAEP